MSLELKLRANAVLDALPAVLNYDKTAAYYYCKQLGINTPLRRHVMGFGCQLSLFERLCEKFPRATMSTEAPAQQWYDIFPFGTPDLALDVKASEEGKTWTISQREYSTKFPGIMIYPLYTLMPGSTPIFALAGALTRLRGEETNFIVPEPSQFNEGFFWRNHAIVGTHHWRFT